MASMARVATKRDHPAERDGRGVHRAQQQPEAQGAEDEGPRPVVDQQPAGHPGGGDDRPDRQVDAGGGDHEGHPDRQHAHDAGLGEHGPDVVGGEERVGLQDGADDEQHDDDDDERVLLQPHRRGQGSRPTAARRRSRHRRRDSVAIRLPPPLRRIPVAPAVTICCVPGMAWRSTSSSVASAPSSSATSSPSRMTRIRVHRPRSSSISDETTITPSPSRARSVTMRNSSALAPTSTPRVGSSSRSTLHCFSSQRASTTFCWLPPESWRARRLAVGRDVCSA